MNAPQSRLEAIRARYMSGEPLSSYDQAKLIDMADKAAALLDVFKAEPFGTNYAAFAFRLGHKTYVDESDKRVTEALWALADALGAPDA